MSFFGVINEATPEPDKATLFPLVSHSDYHKLGPAHKRLSMASSGIIFADDGGASIACANRAPKVTVVNLSEHEVAHLTSSAARIRAHSRAHRIVSLTESTDGVPALLTEIERAQPDRLRELQTTLEGNYITEINGHSVSGQSKPKTIRNSLTKALVASGRQSPGESPRITVKIEHCGHNINASDGKSDGWHCCNCVRNLIEELLRKRHKDSNEPLAVEKIFEAPHYLDMNDTTPPSDPLCPEELVAVNQWNLLEKNPATQCRGIFRNAKFLLRSNNIDNKTLKKAIREIRNSEHTSILHLAAGSGDVAMFNFVLRNQLETFHQTLQDEQAAHDGNGHETRMENFIAMVKQQVDEEFAASNCHNFSDEQVEFLHTVALELANVELVVCQGDDFGRSCLHLAVQHGKEDMLKYIMDLPEEVYKQQQVIHEGTRPLSSTERRQKRRALEDVVNTLQDRFRTSMLGQTTATGETALHYAARYDKHSMVFRLLNYAKTEVHDDEQEGAYGESHVTRWEFLKLAQTPIVRRHSNLLDDLAKMDEHDCSTKMKKDLGIDVTPTIGLPNSLAQNPYRPCPCRAARPFGRCHGSTATGMWHSRNNTANHRTKSQNIAPTDLKHMLEQQLNRDQRIYRDMKDMQGRTALHIAAKMDRDNCCSVLLDLQADPGERDAADKPAIYYMVTNVPTVAADAMNQFYQVDRTTRRSRYFISFLLPTLHSQPELYFYPRDHNEESVGGAFEFKKTVNPEYHGHVIKRLLDSMPSNSSKEHLETCGRLMYDRLLLKESDRKTLGADRELTIPKAVIASMYLKYWWRRLLTAHEYKHYWKSYFTTSHEHVEASDDGIDDGMADDEAIKLDADQFDQGRRADHDRDMLDQIVKWKRMGLVTTPVVEELVESCWNYKGWDNYKDALGYIFFLTIWTTISLLAYETQRREYTPTRIIFEVVGCAAVMGYIGAEIKQYRNADKRGAEIKKNDMLDGVKEVEKIPVTCSDFYYTYTRLADTVDEAPLSEYFGNVWNIFDICGYLLLLTSECFQIANVLDEGEDPDEVMQFWAVRFLSIGLVFSWLKLLKYLRVWKAFGPFVVMLGHMFQKNGDVVKFSVMFIVVLIPFAVAFTLLYGGTEDPELTISYSTIGRSAVSVFRMTVVDYDYEILRQEHENTSAIIVIFWLFLSGIVFLNLFIAMMSTTFQNVHDASARFAAMERATAVVQDMRDRSHRKTLEVYASLLGELDFDGPGEERFKSEFFDDPDDEDLTLPNLRIELLGSVSRNQESLFTLQKDLLEIREQGKKTRNVLRMLNKDIVQLKVQGVQQ